jgi:Kef-type K+ transport system membrane component KefB
VLVADPRSRSWIGGAVLALLATSRAFAAEQAPSGPSEAIFFAQIGLLLIVGRLLGEAMQRFGQPAVMGQLIAGMVLGPSVLGAIWPDLQHAIFPKNAEQKSMIDAVSQLGILMLLLLTGMETDLKLVKRVGKAAIAVSAAGIAVPFACGMALGEMLPDSILPRPDQRFITSIFLGTALSISSVKIVAMVVREMNFMRRNLGQVIVASAILEDTIGWIMVGIAFGLASSGTLDAWSVSKTILGTAAFLAASLTVGRRVVFRLIRWTNDHFVSDFPVITTILAIMVVMALTTHLIGVHSVLGAFVAGVLVGESPILTRHIDEQFRGLIVALFMPVFFGLSGLSADLTILKNADLLLLTGALIVIASVGKFGGAFIGGRLGQLSHRESLSIACGMNARGSTEVIVATVGLSMGVLSQNLFTMIVAMAVITTLAMPSMLRWALARIPLGEENDSALSAKNSTKEALCPMWSASSWLPTIVQMGSSPRTSWA